MRFRLLAIDPATTEARALRARVAAHVEELNAAGRSGVSMMPLPAANIALRLLHRGRGAPSKPLDDMELLADAGPRFVDAGGATLLVSYCSRDEMLRPAVAAGWWPAGGRADFTFNTDSLGVLWVLMRSLGNYKNNEKCWFL